PLRRITRSSDEPKRQHALRAHTVETGADQLLIHLGLTHVAQVTQQSQCAQLVLTEQTLPCLALISAAGERNLPGIGRCQLTRDKALPQLGLRGIHRLSVTEEEHVTQLDRSGAVVLGQRVLVKLGESGSQTLLYLRGKRLLALAPVERHELREFIGTLDYTEQSFGHK